MADKVITINAANACCCGVLEAGITCRSRTKTGTLVACDPAMPAGASWSGEIGYGGDPELSTYKGVLSIVFTHSSTVFGGSYYTLSSISFSQTAGDTLDFDEIIVYFGAVPLHQGDTVDFGWCSTAGGAPHGPLADSIFCVLKGDEIVLADFNAVYDVITNDTGAAGGWVMQTGTDLVTAQYTGAYDSTPNCTNGYLTYNGEGDYSFRYFEQSYLFDELTVGAWYCLEIVYEWRNYGAADWSGAWETTLYASFQADAAVDGPGYLGPWLGDVGWEYEWRVKSYAMTSVECSEACGGGSCGGGPGP